MEPYNTGNVKQRACRTFAHSALACGSMVLLSLTCTSYAVASSAEGLEGLRPSKNLSFWPVSATNVAETGQKERFLEGHRPSKPSAEDATA